MDIFIRLLLFSEEDKHAMSLEDFAQSLAQDLELQSKGSAKFNAAYLKRIEKKNLPMLGSLKEDNNENLHVIELLLGLARAMNNTQEHELRSFIVAKIGKRKIDFFLQELKHPGESLEKKCLIADMDGTLIENETLNDLAALRNVEDSVSAITSLAMNGKLDFNQALTKRVALLAGTPLQLVEDLKSSIRFTKGVKTLFQIVKKKDMHTVLISGGFKPLSSFVQESLGIRQEFSNSFKIINGKLNGEVKKPVINAEMKKSLILKITNNLQINTQDILYIGDGANDLPALASVGIGILFRPGPGLEHNCKHVLRHVHDLRVLLHILGIYQL